jgi:6-pyruvoyl-tetrahydropterin synthase
MTTLTIKIDAIGCHCWPDAPEKYAYLANIHRHTFRIHVEFAVSDSSSREIEIIETKSRINTLLDACFGVKYNIDSCMYWLDFGGMSCEQIANWIVEKMKDQLQLKRVSVFEDNENGASIYV